VISSDRTASIRDLARGLSVVGPSEGTGGGGGTEPPGGGQPLALGDIEPGLDDVNDPLVFPDARFAVNGVPLRGGRKAIINVVGPPEGSVLVRAFAYWQWACVEQPVDGLHDRIRVKRVFPGPVEGGSHDGTLVATGDNPSWCGPTFRNFTYRTDITDIMSATGGGTYAITLIGGSVGSDDHENPWVDTDCPQGIPPLAEGATIVAVYRSSCEPNGTVYIYDTGLTGSTFTSAPGATYTLQHQGAGGAEARIAFVGGDGQVGEGYLPLNGPALINTSINGTAIAGPGTIFNDSDWNGSVGKPLPQLFDVTGHLISQLVVADDTSTQVMFQAQSGTTADVLVPVINVLLLR
jgi:hypothetical protein